MGITSKIITLSFVLGGVALFSQLPEFAQQYRQRLGGAVDELNLVVSEFDKDASVSSMTRDEALTQLKSSDEKFPQERGATMERTVDRFVALSSQQSRIEEGHSLMRPVHVFATPDTKVLKGAWEIFEPAVPINLPGAVYGGAGGLLGLLLARLGLGFRRQTKVNKNDAILGSEIKKSQSNETALEHAKPNLENDQTIGLLDEYPTSSNVRPSVLSDVRFAQKMRGEVDEHGLVVSKHANKHVGKLD